MYTHLCLYICKYSYILQITFTVFKNVCFKIIKVICILFVVSFSMIVTNFYSCYINRKILIDSCRLFGNWITLLMEIHITAFGNIELRLRKKQIFFSFRSIGPAYLNLKTEV